MSKVVLIGFTVAVGIFFEWVLGAGFFIGGVRPPIAAAVFIFWCWRLTPPGRFWLGLLLGIFADSISFLPFGVYAANFMLVVVLMRAFRLFFSNVESVLIESISMALSLFSFVLAAPLFAMVFGSLRGLSYGFEPRAFLYFSAAGVIWALIISTTFLAAHFMVNFRKIQL